MTMALYGDNGNFKWAEHVRVEDPRRTPTYTEYHFTVDGEEFPWRASSKGLTVTRIADDAYTVGLEIFLIDRDELDRYLSFSYTGDIMTSIPIHPLLDGQRFPWLLTDRGCELTFGHKTLPTLKLAFYARDVSGDVDIDDQREYWAGKSVYCNGGHLLRGGTDQCWECEEWFDDLLTHLQEQHPKEVIHA